MRQVGKALLILVAVLALSALACGSSNDDKVTEPTQAPAAQSGEPTVPLPTPTSATLQVYGVGSVVEVKNHTIVLNSAEISHNILSANFTVENYGDSAVSISSMLSFTAKSPDGTVLEQEFFDCGPGLDGAVLVGDLSRGTICWKAAGNQSAKIYYTPELLSSRSIVWAVGEDAPAPQPIPTRPADAASGAGLVVHGIGEIIEIGNHTILLNSAEINQNILSANFTIHNAGAEPFSISSILCFDAKAPDGTKLEQEIFDCGPGLDGSVLAGDKLRGTICWKASGIDSARVYYTPELLSSRTAVWAIGEGAPAAQPVPEESGDAAPAQAQEIPEIGEVIELKDHTIVLNSAQFDQNILSVNLTVQSTGNEDIIISSMLSFEARGPDGTKLEQEIFDCPASLDGTVLAGDNLRGSICWRAPGIDSVRIYYTPDLFSTRAIVWEVSR